MGRLTMIVPKAPFCDFIEGMTSSKAYPHLNHRDPSFIFIFQNSKILLLSSHSTFQYVMVHVAGRETNRAKRISLVKTSLQFYLNLGLGLPDKMGDFYLLNLAVLLGLFGL